MNVKIFNACLLVGWLLVLVGGIIVHPGFGMAFAGLLLIALAIFDVRIAGLHVPRPGKDA